MRLNVSVGKKDQDEAEVIGGQPGVETIAGGWRVWPELRLR